MTPDPGRPGEKGALRERLADAVGPNLSVYGSSPGAQEFADGVCDSIVDDIIEEFAAAWASKCEELARETATVAALREVIRGFVEAEPGWQREAALVAAQVVVLIDEARQDEDFMGRLDRIRRDCRTTPSGSRPTQEQEG